MPTLPSALPSPFVSPEGAAAYTAAYDAALKLWPVPFESLQVDGRYGRTHLVVSGPTAAPSMVLLHGANCSLLMWSPNIADLSHDYRVYAVDVMGQPSKSVPDPQHPLLTRQDCVAWLSELLDALHIERTTLVGMSYGGWLALSYAISAPERLSKIVLLSPAGSFVPLAPVFYQYGSRMQPSLTRQDAEDFLHVTMYEDNLRDPLIHTLYEREVEQFYLGFKYFRPQPQAAPDVFSDEELRGLRVPTLLLIGQQEALYDPTAALERARRLIPQLEGELVPRANHDMSSGQHEVVDRRILEFLTGPARLSAPAGNASAPTRFS